ncbi:hypothetical protein [Microbacterium sp.]|uniref:hypothetical protein n=1 Tax=Microbacterium sp. TaxID=51671 RepID=UPI0028A23B0E|nr:hypothetical protein [Microbacterium sp.]
MVSVATETADAVDDVRVEFASGRTSFLQAKRTLTAGPAFAKAVQQWVKAAEEGLDPTTQRLVIVSGKVSGPLLRLGRLLERMRTATPATLTGLELTAKELLDSHLSTLTAEQQRAVWASAAIWELRVEEPDESDAQNALLQLTHLVAGNSPDVAMQAWKTLLSHAGLTARMRTGHHLAGWLQPLRSASIPLQPQPGSVSDGILRRQDAIAHYFEHLHREGTHIDLRALGADLPPLALEDSAADVEVGVDPEDPRARGELLWAFLRRHRVILTGLPGGGKSTAIRRVAAELTRDDSLPFPVIASLRGLDPEHPTLGIRDQIIEAATKDLAEPHRQEIRAEIGRRLSDQEPIALLLDALDETYNRRHSVVSALQSMVDGFGEGPAVLLATRHVAYAQAATLGWHDLELLPPLNVARTVSGVLELASQRLSIADDEREGWVSERVAWVRRSLADSPVLEETPLLPTFLALLATSRPLEDLPRTRGPILVAVVRDFVLHRELVSRPDEETDPDAALHMGERAFITEAAEILNSEGSATVPVIIEAVASDLKVQWDLAPGAARAAAMKAVRSLDEAGVFVFDSISDRVIPRIALLSEVGAAMFAVEDERALPEWLRRRIGAAQYEAISLACALSTAAMTACNEYLNENPSSASLASAMVQSSRNGQDLDEKQLRNVCNALISDICNATAAGWRHFTLLLRLRVPADLIEHLLRSMSGLPAEYQAIVRSELQYVFGYTGPFVRGVDDFRETFNLKSLPVLPGVDPKQDLSARFHFGLRTPQNHAAKRLLEADPSVAAELVATATSDYSSHATQNDLRKILAARGYHDEVATIDAHIGGRLRKWDLSSMLSDVDEEHPYDFYAVFEEWESAPLTTKQISTTAELASLLQFARLDAYSSGRLVQDDKDYLLSVINFTAQALGLDLGVLAAQAAIILQRMRTFKVLDPSRALAHPEDPLGIPDWARIDDPAHAAVTYARTLSRGLDQAYIAAYMLSKGPEGIVVPELRAAVDRLAASPSHQRLAVMALASLLPQDDLFAWRSDPNAVVREVVAQLPSLPPEYHRALLDDPDRKVRVVALQQFIDRGGPELPELLDAVLAGEPVGWTCRRCGRRNEPNDDVMTMVTGESCQSGTCTTEAPRLRELASSARKELDP